jgi:hypothetical protein
MQMVWVATAAHTIFYTLYDFKTSVVPHAFAQSCKGLRQAEKGIAGRSQTAKTDTISTSVSMLY